MGNEYPKTVQETTLSASKSTTPDLIRKGRPKMVLETTVFANTHFNVHSWPWNKQGRRKLFQVPNEGPHYSMYTTIIMRSSE